MLETQRFLRNGNQFDDLTREYAIKVTCHPTLPLAILNYDQFASPKTHPITRECRALVLHRETHELVAKSFNRFYNWGEVPEEMEQFDFRSSLVQSKEDGSLVLLYHFGGQWRANTRASFAADKIHFHSFTWQEGIAKALGIKGLEEVSSKLDPTLTYVCEFCSPWNKIIRRYAEPTLYLLTAFAGKRELDATICDELARPFFARPHTFALHGIEAIQAHLRAQQQEDPTFEGVVIRDRANQRWKVKSPAYLELHRTRGDGTSLYHPKNLLRTVLMGEQDELLAYFPEVGDSLRECQQRVEEAFAPLQSLWEQTWQIPNQKDFAQAIVGKTPFSGLLFTLRKEYGDRQTLEHLCQAWRHADATILKVLYHQ